MERTLKIRSMGALGEQIGTGKTVNIGAGGVLFTTSMPLLFGEELRLAIALTSREIVITGGSVVRIEHCDGEPPLDASEGATSKAPCSKVAVRFDTISEADQERITCHILQVRRQRRTTGLPLVAPPLAQPQSEPAVPEGGATPAEAVTPAEAASPTGGAAPKEGAAPDGAAAVPATPATPVSVAAPVSAATPAVRAPKVTNRAAPVTGAENGSAADGAGRSPIAKAS
jgi:hypothetical protein